MGIVSAGIFRLVIVYHGNKGDALQRSVEVVESPIQLDKSLGGPI